MSTQSTPSGLLRVALYARTSTPGQEKDESIESQIKALRVAVVERGYTFIELYADDGYSGYSLVRPDLDRLRTDAKEHLFDAVLVTEARALSRGRVDPYILREEFTRLSIRVISLTDADRDDDTPAGALMADIETAFAAYERAVFKERSRRGKLNAWSEGRHGRSHPPYGCRYIPRDRKAGTWGRWEIDEQEADVVRQIYAWAAAGKTHYWISRELNERGVPTRKGGTWWNATVRDLIRNEVYKGRVASHRFEAVEAGRPPCAGHYRRTPKTSLRERPPEEWSTTDRPDLAIVDEDTWQRANDYRALNQRLSPRNTKHHYLLQGLVVCGYARTEPDEPCGRTLSCSARQIRGRSDRVYRCNRRYGTGHDSRYCKARINADRLEAAVWTTIVDFLRAPRQVLKDLHAAQERDRRAMDARARDAAGAALIEQRAHEAIDNLNLAYHVERGLSREEYERLKPRLVEKLQQAQATRREKEAQLATLRGGVQDWEGLEAYCAEVSANLADATDEERRQLVRALVTRVVLEPDGTAWLEGAVKGLKRRLYMDDTYHPYTNDILFRLQVALADEG